MRALHRSASAGKKQPPQRAPGERRRIRIALLLTTSVAMIIFISSQFLGWDRSDVTGGRGTFSSADVRREGGGGTAASETRGAGARSEIVITPKNPYEGVSLATMDGGVANREHDDNVAAANIQMSGEGAALDGRVEMKLGAEGGVQLRDVGRGLTCPPYDLEAFDRELQIPLRHLPRRKKTSVGQKYDRRAHNCAGDGIWNRVTIKDHHDILQNIVRLARIRQGAFVFDWGSGCGHQLDFLSKEFGTSGVGVDVSSKTIAYATANTSNANLHCVADGTKLEWIPTGHFDNAYSFGSIYHVYNRSKFCSILRQMVRIVKPGGTVYSGWTENAEYRRNHVGICLTDLPVKFTIYEEAIEFKNVKIFPLKSSQNTPNTYSLVITKLRGYNSTLYDAMERYSFAGLPLQCGVHQCELKPDVMHFDASMNAAPALPGPASFAPGTADLSSVTSPTARTWSFEGWPTCPAYDARMEELQIPLKHLPRGKKTSVGQKYDRRAHNCASSGVWHKVSIDDHKAILSVIGKTIDAKPGDVVFDWGCGCGHQLEFMYQQFGARGLGIDVSNLTIAYAINGTVPANRFCVADGTRLDWIPDNHFDKAFSFGSIYHVYDKKKFCSVLRQLVRIVKPGGLVYNGWTENAEFHRDDVVKCVNTVDDSWMSTKDRDYYDALIQKSASSVDIAPEHPAPTLAEPAKSNIVREATYITGSVERFSPVESVKPILSSLSINAHFSDHELGAQTDASLARRLLGQGADRSGDGAGGDNIVDVLPEGDLFASVNVFPLKARQSTRSTYSILIRKAKR